MKEPGPKRSASINPNLANMKNVVMLLRSNCDCERQNINIKTWFFSCSMLDIMNYDGFFLNSCFYVKQLILNPISQGLSICKFTQLCQFDSIE